MIYFVDDDINQMRPFRDELEFQDYKVASLRNADEALDCLEKANDIELVIMDVMLGTGPTEISQFNREMTQNFLITGLVLTEKLMETHSAKLKNKVVIFSMSHQSKVTSEIEKKKTQYNLEYLRKSDYPDPYEFVKKLKELKLL